MPTIKISQATRARLEALKRPVKRTGNYTRAQQAELGATRPESFGEVIGRALDVLECDSK